jgi:hypothetical protein
MTGTSGIHACTGQNGLFFSLNFRWFDKSKDLERVTGIEPAQPAWKAGILPLNYTRVPEDMARPYRQENALSRRKINA